MKHSCCTRAPGSRLWFLMIVSPHFCCSRILFSRRKSACVGWFNANFWWGISDGFKAYFWCLKSKSWLKSPCPHVCWFYIIPRFLICFVWLRFLLLNLIIYGSDIINPHRFLDSEPSAVRMTWIPAKRGTGWWYGLGLMRCLAILLLEIPKKSGLMMVKYWSLSKA